MTRIGFLVPPGNPTVEPEMTRLAPQGVTVHFTRMVAHGAVGSHQGQEERNRSQIAHLGENVRLLAMVKPAVIALAHTAMSATLGKEDEKKLVERLERSSGIPFITAFGSVLLALTHLGARRIALATPYGADTTLQTKAHLEAHGVSVVSFGNLENVKNIYEETPERAYALARRVDAHDAQAIFLSGLGMPSIDVLERLERELGKPVFSAASATMWNALHVARVATPVVGYGSLFTGRLAAS
ncbi:MAG TPA: aspartate/glutamate racemase family protein [Burkholderiales bacterium]